MTTDERTTIVLSAIAQVAPDVEPELAGLDGDCDLWEELELDSMDHLSVMTLLSESIGREIPERDYPLLRTVNQISAYVAGDGT